MADLNSDRDIQNHLSISFVILSFIYILCPLQLYVWSLAALRWDTEVINKLTDESRGWEASKLAETFDWTQKVIQRMLKANKGRRMTQTVLFQAGAKLKHHLIISSGHPPPRD